MFWLRLIPIRNQKLFPSGLHSPLNSSCTSSFLPLPTSSKYCKEPVEGSNPNRFKKISEKHQCGAFSTVTWPAVPEGQWLFPGISGNLEEPPGISYHSWLKFKMPVDRSLPTHLSLTFSTQHGSSNTDWYSDPLLQVVRVSLSWFPLSPARLPWMQRLQTLHLPPSFSSPPYYATPAAAHQHINWFLFFGFAWKCTNSESWQWKHRTERICEEAAMFWSGVLRFWRLVDWNRR